MNRTFCFVPVRKGSRGIPGKNLRMLGDKPLVCWIIDTILASGIADEICVATNCDEMESLIRGVTKKLYGYSGAVSGVQGMRLPVWKLYRNFSIFVSRTGMMILFCYRLLLLLRLHKN